MVIYAVLMDPADVPTTPRHQATEDREGNVKALPTEGALVGDVPHQGTGDLRVLVHRPDMGAVEFP